MRILVFGAAGNVGRRVVAEALRRGHAVTAVLRDPSQAPDALHGATLRAGDAARAADVAALSAGHDLVVSATRPGPGHERDHVTTAEALLEGLRQTGVRLLLVGGAGSLLAPDTGLPIVDDERYVQAAWRAIAVACCDQYAVCEAETQADWTYLSPPADLQPGARTGRYRVGGDTLLVDGAGRSAISMEDLAVALLDEAENPRHRRARFTVAH
ncbi:NAD(P)-dependent oxidoreductase [Caenispirillum bisanense]|uniref:NAD(P)-binding domain-containing protein n=1 Tax=Caenispirillum bisanense TaxID=414052 RepID=A0A286G8B4_9PROT|nr:NAD(P)H-binding protein [Caenispirillum bisanense]SOD91702.1 carboxymethylenebutenolidase/hypothetical protein [Caenispirillum bisanense]